MPAQQPVADRMKCARPGQQRGLGTAGCSTTLARNEDLLCAAGHFERGAAGKGQQQQTTRISASEDQPCHPVRQRLGFSGAGSRSDQQRRRPLLCLERPANLYHAVHRGIHSAVATLPSAPVARTLCRAETQLAGSIAYSAPGDQSFKGGSPG